MGAPRRLAIAPTSELSASKVAVGGRDFGTPWATRIYPHTNSGLEAVRRSFRRFLRRATALDLGCLAACGAARPGFRGVAALENSREALVRPQEELRPIPRRLIVRT
jgi:hypothetical protein